MIIDNIFLARKGVPRWQINPSALSAVWEKETHRGCNEMSLYSHMTPIPWAWTTCCWSVRHKCSRLDDDDMTNYPGVCIITIQTMLFQISSPSTLKPWLHKGCFDLKYVNVVLMLRKIFFLLKTLHRIIMKSPLLQSGLKLAGAGEMFVFSLFSSYLSAKLSGPFYFIVSFACYLLLTKWEEKWSFLLYFASVELCLQNRHKLSE